MGSAELTTFYASSCYDYTFDSDMGNKEIYKRGGLEKDADYSINLYSDMGSVILTFKNEE